MDSSDSEGEKEYKPSAKKAVESSDEEDFEEAEEEKAKSKKPVAAKKKTTATTSEGSGEKRKREDTVDASGNQYFELSTKRRVTVRTFPSSGEAAVDIREFYQDKATGESRPGKAGILLPLNQWKSLIEQIPNIEEAIKAISDSGKKSKK